jgi:hypothetical protein
MQKEQQEKLSKALEAILKAGALSVQQQTKVNTTYTFIECEDHITYTLIGDATAPYYALSILSQGYNDIISFPQLFAHESEKSKLIWDLLELGGVRKRSLEIMMNTKIPDNSHLTKEDWAAVLGK